MKKLYTVLLAAVLAVMLAIGVISLVDKDPTFSESENKKLAARPEFTLSGLLDGSFISAFETYYSDTFPMRESLLRLNRTMNRFYYYSGTDEDSVLIISGPSGAELGGQSLDATQAAQEPQTDADAQQPSGGESVPDEPAQPVSGDEQPEQPAQDDPPADEPEQPPELDTPAESDAQWAGNVIVVGTRAMEIPSGSEEIMARYAQAVDNLDSAMPDVRTFSLVTPNGGEFYSPESMHTGVHSQKSMIDYCYSQMQDSVVTVDAYTALRDHADEYIYFRTDHHWTQLGAYYAYTAFCKAAGFDAVPLDEFQTGTYDRFVGSMYTFTSGYPQSQTLYDNPDYLTYYLPVYETHAKYYASSALENGVEVSVVYTGLSDSTSNKYLCFIGGDTPVCVIDSAAEGGTCMVLKESYGNAFVPFLTSHYSRIIVIDPREFNRDGKPSLDLTAFAAEQGVDDLIVINYPYMINNTAYIAWLNRLVGADGG